MCGAALARPPPPPWYPAPAVVPCGVDSPGPPAKMLITIPVRSSGPLLKCPE